MQSTNTSPAARRPEPAPSNIISLPLILLLGCDAELTSRCRSIAARARVLVRASLATLPAQREVSALSPLVIIVPAAVYESSPWGYEVMAERVGASLLMIDREPLASIVLEYRMMEALVFATRLRAKVRENEAREARR